MEEPLNRLGDRSLQRLLREADEYTLATAISGASGKIQVKVIQNISIKRAVVLIGAINSSESMEISHISDCQQQILVSLQNLHTQGDIII